MRFGLIWSLIWVGWVHGDGVIGFAGAMAGDRGDLMLLHSRLILGSAITGFKSPFVSTAAFR